MTKLLAIGSSLLAASILVGCGDSASVDNSTQKVSTMDKKNMDRLPTSVKNSQMSDKRKADIARQMGIRPNAIPGN